MVFKPNSLSDFSAFAKDYQARFVAAVQAWDLTALDAITKVMVKARQDGRQVLIAGNGGSAAIANHTECDATKGTHVAGQPVLQTRSLSANVSLLTALGNDIGFESVFERQVVYYAQPGDVVLLVSSSGNSPNVVKACERAKEMGLTTVAFVGFEGGKLKQLADHTLHVQVPNYGIVEDLHQACVHLITQFLKEIWEAQAKK